MDNYLRIRALPADIISGNSRDWYININNIQSTASDFSGIINIITNNSIGANGFAIELQNFDTTAMTTADECRGMLNTLNDAIFNAKPGQGVITLEGDFPYWSQVEYTQLF